MRDRSPSPQAETAPRSRLNGSPFQLFPPLRDAEYEALKADIAERGQLIPIERDADSGQILDGHHRLAICQELGIRPKFTQRTFKNDAERTAFVIALNLKRRNLDSVTWGRMFKQYCSNSEQSLRKAAKQMGVKTTTAKRRVDTADAADAYPFLEGWKEYRILEAQEKLAKLPEDVRETMADMCGEPAVPPKTAIQLLGNVASMKPKEQREIVSLYQSADERERGLAKTKAVQLPPKPEPRASYLNEVVRELRRYVKQYPDDPFNTRIEIEADHLNALKEEIKKAWNARTDSK